MHGPIVALVPFVLAGCVLTHGHAHAVLVDAPRLSTEDVAVVPGPSQVSLLYVTDRRDLNVDRPDRAYGFERGVAVRVGTARVAFFGPKAGEQLVERTSTSGRSGGVRLRVDEVYEHGTLADGSLAEQVRARVRASGSGDVLVTVHGIGAGFADSLYDLAQIWHHLGRPGVPIAYSWPTGRGGFIQNVYRYDRDSGDFTVPHLRRMLRVLVDLPEVERVSVVAHSRGTAVLVDTLRELRLELLAEGRPPEASKLDVLVLAAPDFDIGLFEQRVLDEGVLDVANHTVLFVSERDLKLMAAGWMHGGPRVGGSSLEALDDLAAWGERLEIVDSTDLARGGRHDHHLADPDAFARLLLALRAEHAASPAGPGAEE